MHRTQLTFSALSLGFASGLALSLGGCRFVEPDPNHCANQDGNAACVEKFGDERPYCLMCGDPAWDNDGCVAEEPTDLDCYTPCGQLQSYNEDASCLAVGDGDGDPGDGDPGDGDPGDGDGDPMVCMGDEDCTDPASPFCDVNSGMCVACDGLPNSDDLCASLGDGAAPVCLEGACVQCVEGKEDACVDTTPICDVAANTCVACGDHGECPDSACNLAGGNCIDPANIIHVDGDFPCPGADGSEGTPYCDIGDALANAPEQPLLVVHERDLDIPYAETNLISGTVAMFAASGEEPILQGVNGTPPVTVSPSGNLFMRGIRLENTPMSIGFAVNGGQAWVEQSRITNNANGGIVVDGGGALVVENSFVGGPQNRRILDIIDGQATVIYSTIGSGFGSTSRAVACSDGTGSSIRNSVVVSYSDQPELDCPNLESTNNFTEDGSGMTFDDLSNWFLDFEGGDFHLAGSHPPAIETTAVWMAGDPTQDIDGDARPAMEGASDVAGADAP